MESITDVSVGDFIYYDGTIDIETGYGEDGVILTGTVKSIDLQYGEFLLENVTWISDGAYYAYRKQWWVTKYTVKRCSIAGPQEAKEMVEFF